MPIEEFLPVSLLPQQKVDDTLFCVPSLNRPNEANFIGDSPAVTRLWDEICARMMAPLTTLWIFAMSTGEGWTASFLRRDILVNTLSPTAYNCFLFHQMIGQWYIAVTRPGVVSWNFPQLLRNLTSLSQSYVQTFCSFGIGGSFANHSIGSRQNHALLNGMNTSSWFRSLLPSPALWRKLSSQL